MPANLISPEWISTSPREDILIFEVGTDSRKVYRAGHIPGAVYFDTNLVERPPLWNRLPDDTLAQVLPAYLTHNKTAILYARGSSAAARVAVILLYAGVRDVRLLDGGFSAWLTAGYPVETGENQPVAAATFGIMIPARPEVFVDTKAVKAILAGQRGVIASIQSWGEYIGETSGYAFIQPKGRIAGAVWGHAGVDRDGMEAYHNPDGTARPLDKITEAWRKRGITPDQTVVFYCGTGWRASEAFFYAYTMGWKKIAVYDGGWQEWSRDPANPIETGLP